MTDFSPHSTILGLHHKVDASTLGLYGALDLDPTTETVVKVDRSVIDSLSNSGRDPQAALVHLTKGPPAPALLIAEPALCSTVLARMWKSNRNHGTPMTQVEGEIIRQHLADLCFAWHNAWSQEGVRMLPELTLAGPLTMLRPQLPEGTWYIARTVVLDVATSEAVGVLLFCYPESLVLPLSRELRRTRWRSRLADGLTPQHRNALHNKLRGELRNVVMPIPVTLSTTLPVHMLNTLERGDVMAFDAQPGNTFDMVLLDQPVTVAFVRSAGKLALRLLDVPNPNAGPQDFFPQAAQQQQQQYHEPVQQPDFA
jgi:hypothetical protein